MRRDVAGYPDLVWAVEGSNDAGRPLAQRLLADGEYVVDVPAKLSAKARALDTGHNRKTDPHDAHAIAVVAVRTPALRVLPNDVQLEALRPPARDPSNPRLDIIGVPKRRARLRRPGSGGSVSSQMARRGASELT